LPSFTQFLP